MKTALLAAGATLALTSTLALAQMVPPAPDKAPTPEQAIPVTPPQRMVPPMPELQVMPTAPVKRAAKEPVKLPNLPYKSLIEKDKSGKVVMLTEPAEYAALKNNPMVTAEERAKLEDYFQQRRGSFEIVVAENLDLVEKIEDGFFEKIDLGDKKNFVELMNVARPLKAPAAPKQIYQDLKDKGLLTEEQSAFNQKIAGEYHGAVIASMNADTNRNMAMFYKQFVEEPIYIHRLMKIDAARNIDSILPALQLDAGAAGKAKAAAAKAKSAKTDDARIAAIDELNAGLSIDQRKALMRETMKHGKK